MYQPRLRLFKQSIDNGTISADNIDWRWKWWVRPLFS